MSTRVELLPAHLLPRPEDVAAAVARRKLEQAAPAPDVSNGRSNTTQQLHAVLIDGFRVTFPFTTRLEVLLRLFGGWAEWEACPHGVRGYQKGLKLPGIFVWYDGPTVQGIHVEVQGQGCRHLEETGRVHPGEESGGWRSFFSTLLSLGGRFVRCDPAIDERAGILGLQGVWGYWLRGWRVSRWRQARPFYRDVGGREVLEGIGFGDRKSRCYGRMYDKAMQQGEEGHRTRAELELHADRAHAFVCAVVKHGLAAATVGVWKEYLTFVEPDTATRRERCQACAWWLDVVGHADKLRLWGGSAKRRIEEVGQWLQRAVAPALAACAEAFGGEFLVGLLNNGERRQDKYRPMIAEWRAAWAAMGGT